jgi:hypothetical protein
MKRAFLGLLMVLCLVSGSFANSFGFGLEYEPNADLYNLRMPLLISTGKLIPLPNSYVKLEPVASAPRTSITNIKYNYVSAVVGFKMPVAGGTFTLEGGPYYRFGRNVDVATIQTTNSIYNTVTNTVTNNTTIKEVVTDTITNTITNNTDTTTTIVKYWPLPIPDYVDSDTTSTTTTDTAFDSNVVIGIPETETIVGATSDTITTTSTVLGKDVRYQDPLLTWGINANWSISW